MGKKRIVSPAGQKVNKGLKSRALARGSRRKISEGILHVQSTYNNNKILLTDMQGNAVVSSSSGSLGFRGAKKGTPFAANEVGSIVGEKAKNIGVKEIDVVVRGAGQGREGMIRGFISHGIMVRRIRDKTGVPFGGCRPKKARHV